MHEEQPVLHHAEPGAVNRRKRQAAAVIERLASHVRTRGRRFTRDEMNAR